MQDQTNPGQMIFLNLPVADVKRSRAFYTALGFGFDERFCDDTALCVKLSDTIFFMLLETEKFAGFAPLPVGDAKKESQHLIALSRDSRAAVDEITEAAIAAGGTDINKVQEMGDYMYGRAFTDPDGHVLEVMWMDVDAAMKAWGQPETA